MKKISALIVFCCSITTANAQFEKFTSIRAGTQIDFRMDAPGLDDVGVGFNLDVSLFAKKRLMLLTTVHKDWFAGDKQFIEYGSGRTNNRSTSFGISAGPEFFVDQHLAISATYGLFRHSIREDGFTTDDGLRLGVVTYTGKRRRFVIKLNRTDIFNTNHHISYHTLGFGWRIL